MAASTIVLISISQIGCKIGELTQAPTYKHWLTLYLALRSLLRLILEPLMKTCYGIHT